VSRTAGIESVLGRRRTSPKALVLLATWSALAFALAGWLGRGLGPWAPDPGVVLLLGLVARARPAGLWSAALAVSLGRIAVGVDPPLAVLTVYLGIAGLHAGLCRVADGNRVLVRFLGAGSYAALVVVWLIAVHESRADVPLGLLERAPGFALPTAMTTAVAAAVLSPALSRLPGLGAWRDRA
jgi:hypothetical protein